MSDESAIIRRQIVNLLHSPFFELDLELELCSALYRFLICHMILESLIDSELDEIIVNLEIPEN